jgi:hypothetical protein
MNDTDILLYLATWSLASRTYAHFSFLSSFSPFPSFFPPFSSSFYSSFFFFFFEHRGRKVY